MPSDFSRFSVFGIAVSDCGKGPKGFPAECRVAENDTFRRMRRFVGTAPSDFL